MYLLDLFSGDRDARTPLGEEGYGSGAEKREYVSDRLGGTGAAGEDSGGGGDVAKEEVVANEEWHRNPNPNPRFQFDRCSLRLASLEAKGHVF